MTDMLSITVPVPAGRVAEALRALADMHDSTIAPAAQPDATPPMVVMPEEQLYQFARGAYTGGESDYWRPMLDYLASCPDEDVRWDDILAAIGLEPRQASGMLGAAERRCMNQFGQLPYAKRRRSGEHYFNMPGEIADLITAGFDESPVPQDTPTFTHEVEDQIRRWAGAMWQDRVRSFLAVEQDAENASIRAPQQRDLDTAATEGPRYLQLHADGDESRQAYAYVDLNRRDPCHVNPVLGHGPDLTGVPDNTVVQLSRGPAVYLLGPDTATAARELCRRAADRVRAQR